ncbi:MAG: hypothetical protein OXG65_14570 [Chloroflexi bacterium]|nr:hypothetical protein [Chloroflexota bacterium]
MPVGGFDPLTWVHFHEADPGTTWTKDTAPAIEFNSLVPGSGVLTPNVVALAEGGYRMYYTGFAPGMTKSHLLGHILSASSPDGSSWTLDDGVRIDVHGPHASQRTLCPDVVPIPGGGYRMYYEARTPDAPTVILSATSRDGLDWGLEDGVRIGDGEWSYGSPRCVYFPSDRGLVYRLYFHHYSFPLVSGLDAQNHIVSAMSRDGLNFEIEPGVRIAQDTERETFAVYAPEVVRLGDGSFRMFYAAWAEGIDGGVFTAVSGDGIAWTKSPKPLLDLDVELDCRMVSEPCVIELPDRRCRMFYEARDSEGRARILSATSG